MQGYDGLNTAEAVEFRFTNVGNSSTGTDVCLNTAEAVEFRFFYCRYTLHCSDSVSIPPKQ